MEFGKITGYLTGVAVPVFSLRTQEGLGIGEFLDLIKFGRWCKEAGIDLIQILPVNDTGGDSSPYNAISAYALHPIYVRLEEIEGWEAFKDEIMLEKSAFYNSPSVNYKGIYAFKESILRKIYENNVENILNNLSIERWIKENSWIIIYSVYRCIKDLNKSASWLQWEDMKNPQPQEIESYFNSNKKEVYFYCWVQYNLEEQLRKASLALQEMGLRLKGDIPILINEDSADVWGRRQYFDLTFRAGAPPDMFSEDGQNWMFPCYKWDVLEKEDYSWWKDRLNQAAKFYHAYRIDHVLGFFRIWQINSLDAAGTLGHFDPANPITHDELKKAGFDDNLIDSLARPVFPLSYIREMFHDKANHVIANYLTNIGDNKFAFAEKITGEKAIFDLDEDSSIKDKLVRLYRDRVLIKTTHGNNNYLPSWFYYSTRTFNGLSDDKKERLRQIIGKNKTSQDDLWRKNGLKLLKMMCSSTDMLVCAEDLGAIPDCVPSVLHELDILSLKVERWARKWNEEGAPYIDPKHYPRLSVSSPSVHDTTTLRGWWEEGNWDRQQYFRLLGMSGGCPTYLTSELSAKIIERNLNANSILTIFLLPDLLGLYYNLRTANPYEERINLPGTVSDKNWSYKMKDNIERLIAYKEYNDYLRNLIEKRKNRKL
ncbi:4-alpha-glucanotransferase [Candidatus Magnetoovum chiemensis]|nr:4-alpha-glucanotransferase [Candidatus Magnetoovum chiemensis]